MAPIAAADARALVRRVHYSGKVDPRSVLHLGVFWGGRIEGALQFGPSLDKRKVIGLVRGTRWNAFLELNRLAFTEKLPRNSESRALGVALRMIRRAYPHVEWVLSYADATRCGDGTIYRAAGFLLTGIRENTTIWRLPCGECVTTLVLQPSFSPNAGPASLKARLGILPGESARSYLRRVGAERVPGYQVRYIRFLDPSARARLTVPVIPFSRIAEVGAGMYRGKPRAESRENAAPAVQVGEGGVNPTSALPPGAA